MMTVSVNSKKLNEQLGYLHDALIGAGQAGDAATLIKDQARLLVRDAIKFTLPLKSVGGSDKKQGERAVERDIGRAMAVPDPTKWTSKKIRKMIETEDEAAFAQYLRRTKSAELKKWRVEPFSKELHQGQRDRRGRIQRQRRVFVLAAKKVSSYIKETQKHVGYMRAGWLAAANATGLAVKAPWIKRHTNAKAIGVNRLSGERPSVTIGNATPGIGQIRRSFDRALMMRE